MADTSDEATMEEHYIPFFKSIINVFREHQASLSSLPEAMERVLQSYSSKINQTQHLQENSHQEMESERQEAKGENPKGEEEITKSEMEINETEKQREEFYWKKERELKEWEEKISRREDGITKREEKITEREKQFDKWYEKKKREMQEEKEELAKKEKKISETEKRSKEELLQAKQESIAANKKMEAYKLRLASLSEKRVRQDQTHVENILESNRQSELEKDFLAFFDNERMDACDVMRSKYCHKEDDFVDLYYPRLACLIFETAYEQAKDVHEAASHIFKEITKSLSDNAAGVGWKLLTTRKLFMDGRYPYELCSVPFDIPLWRKDLDYLKDVMDGMTLSVKEAAPTCSLDFLTQDVANIAYAKWVKWYQEDATCFFCPSWHFLSEHLVKYINDCIKLTWKMVTQIPPMKLEYDSSKFDKEIHRNVSSARGRMRSSTQKDQDEEIKCYLWPGLQDGNGRRIRHGEVLCKLKPK